MTTNAGIVPGVKPPAGQQSNFVDPPSKRGLIIAVAVLAITLSTSFLCLRLYTRRFINRKLWWDDWACILGWIGLTALAALMFKALDYGGAVDLWNVPKAKYAHFTKLFHNIEIVGRVAMFFTKASIVLLFHRIFIPVRSRRTAVWWGIWFVFWWNLLYTVALILVVTTECVNKGAKVARGQECLDQSAIVIGATVINVVSDLMILVIPIVAIWNLQMARSQKYRLSAVFTVGLLGVMASIARLGYLVPMAQRPNQTVIVMVLLIFNIVEQTIGIIVGCMPVLPALYRHLSEHYLSSSSKPSRARLVVNSFFANRAKNSGSRARSDKPSVLTDYEELDDIEGQWEPRMPARPAKSFHTTAQAGK